MTTIPNKSNPVKHKCFNRKWRPYTTHLTKCAEYWIKQCQLTKSNPYESRAWEVLKKYHGWKRQYFFGRRIFDFFHEGKGIAIEIDGSSHCKNCDQVRDKYLKKKYGILTVRFFNSFHSKELEEFLGRTCLRSLKDFQIRKLIKFRARLLKTLPKKKKKGKKEKGFQQSLHFKNQVSKEKIKKKFQGQNSSFGVVRKNLTDHEIQKQDRKTYGYKFSNFYDYSQQHGDVIIYKAKNNPTKNPKG